MTAEKIRLLVLFGGRSGEHEVSLQSARSVLRVLDADRYRVFPVGITREGRWLSGDGVLERFMAGETAGLTEVTLLPDPSRPHLFSLADGRLQPVTPVDVVFPVLHGTFGEDGTLQGLLELTDLAYVGAGVLGAAVGMDKALFKDVMRAHGISVLPAVLALRHEIATDAEAVIRRVEALGDYPFFTKPCNLGSSVGVNKCRNRDELLAGLQAAARYDRRVLVERGVTAREIEISVLGNESPIASVPGEIVPGQEFYTYEAKYEDDTSELLIPAPLSDTLANEMRQVALQAYRAIDGAGMARVDFLLEANGRYYLNEVNTIPGFTQISMYPKLWQASGMAYGELIDRLIALALERKAQRDSTERHFRRPV